MKNQFWKGLEPSERIFKRTLKECWWDKIISNYSETDKYCNARVWNGGSITVIDDKTTIYGGRCSRPHIKRKEYCHQHIIKNKHQNYFKNPSPELIQHFKKYSLNNNK